MSVFEKIFTSIVRISMLAWLCALTTPLMYGFGFFVFPFIVPKALFFIAMTSIACVGAAMLIARDPERFLKLPRIILYTVLAYTLALVVGVIISIHPALSWWGTYERMLGVSTMLFFPLYFFTGTVLITYNENPARLRRITLRILWIVGVIVALLGIFQHESPSSFLLAESGGRVYSTLGNFIYFGGFMNSLFWIALILLFSNPTSRIKGWYVLSALIAFTGILLSGSRGPLLGFLVGCAIFGIVQFLTRTSYSPKKIILSVTGTLILVIGTLALPVVQRHVGALPVVGRVLSVHRLFGDASPRLIAWRIGLESFQAHPLFGYGHESFYSIFNERYNPQSLRYSLYETWFDNAHNIVVNTLAERGLLGLLTLLALYGMPIYYAYTLYKKRSISNVMLGLFAAALISSFVTKLSVFDEHTSLLVLFVLLLWMQTAQSSPSITVNEPRIIRTSVVGILTIMSMCVILYGGVYIPGMQNHAIFSFAQLFQYSPLQATSIFEKTYLSPFVPFKNNIGIQFIRTVAQNPEAIRSRVSAGDTATLYQNILHYSKELIDENPRDVQLQLLVVNIIVDGKKYIPHYQSLIDTLIQKAIAVSPNRQQVYFTAANVALQDGKYDAAKDLLEKARLLDPTIALPYYLLATVYLEQGKIPESDKAMTDAVERGYGIDTILDQYLEKIYDTAQTKKITVSPQMQIYIAIKQRIKNHSLAKKLVKDALTRDASLRSLLVEYPGLLEN